jgi:Domain of unknown function (DUF5666)
MRLSRRTRRLPAALLVLIPTLLVLVSCGDGDSGPSLPTEPSLATLSGTVIRGSGRAEATVPKGMALGLAGVTVSVVGSGPSTVTDGSGSFTLTGVRVGAVELEFQRADIHARGRVNLTSGGSHSMTFAIVGSRAVGSPGGHAGEEIEGLVQAIDAGAGSLTVLDQRLGAVVIETDADTLVRRGDATIPLSDIQIGMRVHVKALDQGDGSFLATEVLLQNERIGGMREVSGSIASVDESAGSFVVESGPTTVVIETDGGTDYKKRGGPASFADVVVGAAVEVKGILQSDGSVLARKVRIES